MSDPSKPQGSDDKSPTKLNSLPEYVAGVSRSVTAGIISTLGPTMKQTLLWWFKMPVKLFRPYAVNPWTFIQQSAKNESKQLDYTYIVEIAKRDGTSIFGKRILPMLLANSLAGICLFQSYSATYHFLHGNDFSTYFMAGGIAGLTQSFVSTPLHNIGQLITKSETKPNLNASSKSIHAGGHFGLLYRGCGFNCIRDTIGYALFFGVFESMQIIGNSNRPRRKHPYPIDSQTLESLRSGVIVVLSGGLAGAAYQTVAYPLNRFRILTGMNCQQNRSKSQIPQLLMKGFKSGELFSGISSQILRAVPPSALGLLIYEISKDWVAKL